MAYAPQGILLVIVICCIATSSLQNISPKTKTGEPVTKPPTITKEPAKETAYKPHEKVELMCEADADPLPEYEWYKNGNPLVITGTDIKKEPGRGSIIIEDPNSDHDGIYQCRARNEFGIAISVNAMLKFARQDSFPTVTEPKIWRPEVGSYLKLACDPPYSYPSSSISWVMSQGGGVGGSDGDDSESDYDRVESDERISLDYHGSLHFANIEIGDARDGSNYVCQSGNSFLRTSSQGDDQRVDVIDRNLYFANIEESDAIGGRKYVCMAMNRVLRVTGQGSDQKIEPQRVTATPKYQAPKVEWWSDKVTTAIKGNSHKMKCIFSGYPTPTVTWERKGGQPLSSNMRIRSHGQELYISEAHYEDDGQYDCVAHNTETGKRIRMTITLIVESVPEWDVKPEDVISSEEEDAEFICKASGHPRPTITWSINGKSLDAVKNPRRTISSDGTTLSYTNLTKTDAQVLQCNASNKHGYSYQNAYLNVLAEPPNIYEPPEPEVKAAVGQTVVIRCRVFGAPKPIVTWKKGNPGVEVSGSRFKTLDVGDLQITTVQQEDEDDYECFAWNKFGTMKASGKLTVRSATKITDFPKSHTVNASAEVTFTCKATTDPHELHKLTIEWKRNGEPIDYEREGRFTKDTQTNALTITDAKIRDTAQYTCYASNELDSDESTASLRVRDRPDAPFNIKLMHCLTRSARISWMAGPENNAEVEEFIIYYNTTFDEEGEYHYANDVPKGISQSDITLSPWANFTFHVKARNELGVSEPSEFSHVCTTQAAKPEHHPKNVCTDSREPDQLVITWDRVEKIDQNGEGFHYLVHYKRADIPDLMEDVAMITNWETSEYIVKNQEPFKKYEIMVKSHNEKGEAPKRTLQRKIGYSGEDVPLVTPEDFAVDEGSVNATSALFTWSPVDDDPSLIRGHFKGYLIKFWKSDDKDDVREHLVPVGNYEPCPDLNQFSGRGRRAADVDRGHVMNLWPYSRITAGVLVVNGGKSGEMSDTIEFSTPEGFPGIVGSFDVTETGSHHLKVEWTMPLEPNGIIIGYTVGYQEAEKPRSSIKKQEIDDPTMMYTKIKDLEETTDYNLFVWARTIKGPGVPNRAEGRTLLAGAPDKPAIAKIESGDSHLLVSWDPTEDDGDDANPGSEFYVEYRPAGSDGPWERSAEEPDHNSMNITGLNNGDRYEVRIVAVNKHGETFSDPTIVQVGGAAVSQKEDSIATAGWFIGMMLAIIFLLLIIIIVCLIKRNRGGKYPVHEKEKLRGNNPEKEDEEDRFGEYTRTDEPEYKKSAASLNSKRSLESETDSMAEYDHMDPSKFNEDGSFIGQYMGNNDAPKKPLEPDATSPSALSTLV